MEYEGKSWEIWMEELESKAPRTQQMYKKALKELLGWLGWGPEQLFEEYLSDLKSDDPRDIPRIGRKVKNYMAKLEREGYSSSHARKPLKAARSFFMAQGIPLQVNHVKKVKSRKRRKAEHGEIRKLLEYTTSARNKAIILALKDSGLRIGDLVALKIGDVIEAIKWEKKFTLIEIIQKKTGFEAKPILGPESLQYIGEWLREREKLGFKTTPDSTLFLTVKGEDKGEPLKSNSISAMVIKIVKRAGLSRISPHSFRRFHTTNLQASEMPEPWIAILQGREIGDSRGPYTDPDDSQLLEAYEQAYKHLSVFETPNEIQKKQNQEIEELRKQLEDLRRVVMVGLDKRRRRGEVTPEQLEKHKQRRGEAP